MTRKNSVLENYIPPYNTIKWRVLSCIEGGYFTNSLILTRLKITKQCLQYWLTKLLDEGLIIRPRQGIYKISPAGKRLLGGYIKQQNKSLIRLENMRYKYPIIEGFEKVISLLSNHKTQQLGSITIHHGTFYDFTIRVFESKIPSLEITCKQAYGYDIYEMMYKAKSDVESLAQVIDEEKGVKLGLPEPTMEPEWAISSPIAEHVLSLTCSSQIRTSIGTYNRSKGRNADLETRDIRLAHEILLMPEMIRQIKQELGEIKSLIMPIPPISQHTVQKKTDSN